MINYVFMISLNIIVETWIIWTGETKLIRLQLVLIMGSSYRAHIMLCALHTYYPWSRDLFIHVPFQLPFLEHTALAAISALGTSHTHCHLCSTRYSSTPESSAACEGKVSSQGTQHRNNVPILRGGNMIFLWKFCWRVPATNASQPTRDIC